MQTDYQNPFDNDKYTFLVLLNGKNQYSLWPEFTPIPDGWTCVFGPESRQQCIGHIEQHWVLTD